MKTNKLIEIQPTGQLPRVYVGGIRIHHWMPGAFMLMLGVIKRKTSLALLGGALVLDDFPDFLETLQRLVNAF